jgi:hypothetical protein
MKCPDALLPDGDTCPRCGGPRAPSGVDGGSWVHIDTSPDRVVMTYYSYGKCVRQVLANGVVIRPKVK